MRKSRRKRRRRRRTRRGRGKKGKKGKHSGKKADHAPIYRSSVFGVPAAPSAAYATALPTLPIKDTTNGELSVEKTIEGQQPRDDGGGGGEGVRVHGPGVTQSGKTAQIQASEMDGYFFPSAAHAVAGRPADSAAADNDLPPLEELTKTELLMRELADSSDDDSLEFEAERAELEAKREKRRAYSRALRQAGVSVVYEEDTAPKDPWMVAAREHILQDPDTRTSLEKMKRDTSPVFFGLADGVRAVSPVPPAAEGERLDREEAEAQYRWSLMKQKQWEKAAEYDKEELAREAAAAAAKDKKVREAARWAADEWDVSDDEDLMFGLDMGGGRRKRRRRRRRTRKKRAGYGPIATGGWIPHNLLLPSQHLGSLGMWWT